MAKRTPIVIDGEVNMVDEHAKLEDVVPASVRSVVTHDGELISKSAFRNVAPPVGFATNLSEINKGKA